MKVAFTGYAENVTTLETDGAVKPGTVVKMKGNGMVGPCSAKDKFCGVALSIREQCAAVQLNGYVRVAYTGTAPAVGWALLNANGSGGVQAEASGREMLVMDVDPTAHICGVML